MTTTQHTPAPWEVATSSSPHQITICQHNGERTILHITWPDKSKFGLRELTAEDHANAAHIVHCINSHASLVAALRAARADLFELGGEFEAAREHGDRISGKQCVKRRDEIYAMIDDALAGEPTE